MDDSVIVNKRKRKSGNQDMIFEVNEEDCSPSNSGDEDCTKISTNENFNSDNANSNLNSNLHSVTKSFITFDQGTQTEDLCNINSERLVTQLTEENMKLKEKLQLLEKNLQDVKDDNNPPCISIKFKNTSITDLHSLQLKDLMRKMFQDNCKIEQISSCEIGVYQIDIKNLSNIEISSDISSNNYKKRRHRSPTPPPDEECLFMEDTTPTLDPTVNRLKYSNRFDTIQESNSNGTPKVTRQSECWNCGGTHSMRECKEPLNYPKINAARKKFNISKSASRYHLEDDQRFGHLVPGKLSEKLRRALGLRKNELPPYVYKMRRLGYPPGWLKEVIVSYSELDIYTIDGKVDACNKQVKIDSEKVVEYAGFNVPLEKGIKDEYKHYHCPPYSNRHSKNAMLDSLYKMYRVPREGDGDIVEACDMEISNEDCIQQPNVIGQGADSKRENTISPSLIDLEMKKNQLLAELDIGSTSNSPISEVNKEADAIATAVIVQVEQSEQSTVLIQCPEKIPAANLNDEESSGEMTKPVDTTLNEESCGEMTVNTPQKRVVASTFGTPILKSASPYSTLPKSENFAKDVSEVINFENLPDSTGKYDQMVNVLEKVRSTLKSLNSVKKT